MPVYNKPCFLVYNLHFERMKMKRTHKSRIRGMLRQMFLRSVERSEALKRDKYTCQKCGVKQSKAKGKEQKVEVHHKSGIDIWEEVIYMIYDELLCDIDNLETLCHECHKKEEK
jgi:5-methylcytosine-specific restriction endonuclease McrA